MTVKRAHSIATSCCEHGVISIRLLDQSGKVFASAEMSPQTACHLANDLLDTVERDSEVMGYA